MNNLDFINCFDSVEDDSLTVLKDLDSNTQKKLILNIFMTREVQYYLKK